LRNVRMQTQCGGTHEYIKRSDVGGFLFLSCGLPNFMGDAMTDIERVICALKEGEACAKLCEKMSESTWTFCNFAEAIRARSEK